MISNEYKPVYHAVRAGAKTAQEVAIKTMLDPGTVLDHWQLLFSTGKLNRLPVETPPSLRGLRDRETIFVDDASDLAIKVVRVPELSTNPDPSLPEFNSGELLARLDRVEEEIIAIKQWIIKCFGVR